jgi:hypothetical protein
MHSNDWSAVSRTRELYQSIADDYAMRRTQIRALFRYLYAATHDISIVKDPPTPELREIAESTLEELRILEPQRYAEAVRSLGEE